MKRAPAIRPNQPATFEKTKRTPTEAALDLAMASIHTLVVETLNDTNRHTRFHDAANLCNLGQAMKRVFAQQVADFVPGCGDDFNVHNANPIFPGVGYAVNQIPAIMRGRDQDAVRGIAGGMEDMLQVQAKAAKAATAASVAAELKDLCDLRDRFQRDPTVAATTVAPLTVRINHLLQGLEAPHAPDAPPLVPAVVPR